MLFGSTPSSDPRLPDKSVSVRLLTEAGNQSEQRVGIDRFIQMSVKTRSQRAVGVFKLGPPGHRDDGNRLVIGKTSQRLCQLVTSFSASPAECAGTTSKPAYSSSSAIISATSSTSSTTRARKICARDLAMLSPPRRLTVFLRPERGRKRPAGGVISN